MRDSERGFRWWWEEDPLWPWPHASEADRFLDPWWWPWGVVVLVGIGLMVFTWAA